MNAKLAIALILILAPLIALQYHRVNELGEAERVRMKSNLEEGVRQFADAFNREITAAYIYFYHNVAGQGDPRARMKELLTEWRAEESVTAEIIGQIYLTAETPERTWHYRDDEDRWEEVPTPPELSLLSQHRGPPMAGHAQFPGPPPFEPAFSALVIPLDGFLRRSHQQMRNHEPRQRLILLLDRTFLRDAYFPEMTAQHINPGDKKDYLVTVLGSGPEREVIYQSEGGILSEHFDASEPLFRLGSLPNVRNLLPAAPDHAPLHHGARRIARSAHGQQGGAEGSGERLWQLGVVHRRGSLEAAMEHFRLHNALLNGLVLLILISGIGLVIVSAQRARALAQRQLQFVAGISHEILTPLAGIRSAAQNLADGLVSDAEKVRTYGTMIENEGGRLADLVEKALEFAGIGTARDRYHFQRVTVAEVVAGALASCRAQMAAKGFCVTTDLAADLPPLRADGAALERVLINLVTNALKYAADDPRIEIRARAGKEGGVRLEVADHGPGIDAADLPHLWEPFYRGERARASQIQGSGLGLCLVQNIVRAHGGKVFVAATGPLGTVFAVTLPSAPAGFGEADRDHSERG